MQHALPLIMYIYIFQNMQNWRRRSLSGRPNKNLTPYMYIGDGLCLMQAINGIKIKQHCYKFSTLSAVYGLDPNRNSDPGPHWSWGLPSQTSVLGGSAPSCLETIDAPASCCLLSSNMSSRCPHNMMNFGPLAAEISSGVSSTPYEFQRVSRLSSVTARYSSSAQPNFSALNRGRHLYWAARPSSWAFSHIVVSL